MCIPTIYSTFVDPQQLSLTRDEWTGRLFMASEQSIREGFVHANAILAREGDLSYNDLMDHLGLAPVMSGDDVGWSGDFVEPVIKAGLEHTPYGVKPILTLEFSRTPQPTSGFH